MEFGVVLVDILAAIGAILLGLAGLLLFYLARLASDFYTLTCNNTIDVGAYCGDPTPSFKSRIQVSMLHRLNVGSHVPSKQPVSLASKASPFVDGLLVTSCDGAVEGASPMASPEKGAVVVGTIRMGFGHHRIAYAAASWGLAAGKTYFHDLLNIDSAEATLIKDMDKLYSKGSRLATELGGPVEKLWGSITKSGDANALRCTYQMAEHLKPLLLAMPKDTPIVATHSLVGLIAVSCGFTNVINLVIDNHAQWFIVVPGALNLVQGPSNYHSLLRMGVPPDQIQLVGAWIPKDLVDNIGADCKARKARAAAKKPTRLLIPVGGAGAQRTFVCNLVIALKDKLRAGEVQLLLNAGDHAHMKSAFVAALKTIGAVYELIDTLDGVRELVERMRQGCEPKEAVTLFAFDTYFPAVATTDIVCRVTDVLCCKPSELAFYPVPKLMIRRVGDHEAYSALRASELGDGTLELRETSDALAYVNLFKTPDLLAQMNDCIIANNTIGLYDGCKKAIEISKARAKKA
mmetsp:Transcript_41431/g.96877  ORF Transcript_41431/g.96877 Transcript_41431/m.96877 type:complete len:518 (-) Transcript_41431:516-2069(-)